MPKIILVLSLAAAFLAQSAPAPSPAPPPDWQLYTQPGEEFTVELPAKPTAHYTTREVKDSPTEETEPARVYTAYHDGVVFLVASYDKPRPHESLAFFADEFLGGEELPRVEGTFQKNVRSGKVGGWEYAFTHAGVKGVARLFLTKKHAYMAEAVGGDASHPAVARFLSSFELSPSAVAGRPADKPAPRLPTPVTIDVDPTLFKADKNPPLGDPTPARNVGGGIGTGEGVGIGPGRGAPGAGGPATRPPDPDGPFQAREVTRKAVIVFKPRPGYTEEARRNVVTGLVRLRCVLSSNGGVSRLSVIKGLPDGLTEKAIAAASLIRFLPASKDGRRVSQFVTLEYNFNIY